MGDLRKYWRVLLVLTLLIGALFVFCVGANAESGTYDGVDWDLTDGVLTIGKAGTSQTFVNQSSRNPGSWPWNSYRSSITSVKFVGSVIGQGSMLGMFQNCSNLASFDASGFDTSKVTNMTIMFQNCSSLHDVDLSSFNGCDGFLKSGSGFQLVFGGLGEPLRGWSPKRLKTALRASESVPEI